MPQIPPIPWTANVFVGSSIFKVSITGIDSRTRIPAIIPITMASQGRTTVHPPKIYA